MLFSSQILLLVNAADQLNGIRQKQEQIDRQNRNLDAMAAEFARLLQDVTGAAVVTMPPVHVSFNYLQSVQFAADGKRGWAVGDRGAILFTQNDGETWQSETSGTTNSLQSVQCAADGKRAWTVGDGGTILVT